MARTKRQLLALIEAALADQHDVATLTDDELLEFYAAVKEGRPLPEVLQRSRSLARLSDADLRDRFEAAREELDREQADVKPTTEEPKAIISAAPHVEPPLINLEAAPMAAKTEPGLSEREEYQRRQIAAMRRDVESEQRRLERAAQADHERNLRDWNEPMVKTATWHQH